MKQAILQRICDVGLVAVVRAKSQDQAMRITDACIRGGAAAIEITFTTPKAHQVIEALAKAYTPKEILLGAGTVLDSETARISMLSGAQYVVSPMLSPEVIKMCNRYRVPVMPGVQTLRDCIEAMELGCDILKLFPGELMGPAAIKAIRGPLPHAQMMPTGGVSPDNAHEWIKAGAVALGAGGSLTAGADTEDYEKIVTTAKLFLEKIAIARGQK